MSRSRRDAWQLVSDHPDTQEWPTLRWPDDAEIIGEVTWAARAFAELVGDMKDMVAHADAR